MANKPPAFQLYAKDWRSSPTIQSMSLSDEGLFIRLCTLAWDSDDPGIIALPIPKIARLCRVDSAKLSRFLAEFPATFERTSIGLLQKKLHDQFLKYKEISEKRSQAASKCSANAQQLLPSAFAVASASASAQSKETPGSSRTAFYFQNKKDEAAWKEFHVGEGPSDQVQTGGFVMHTCEVCGLRGTKGAVARHKCGKLAAG